MPTTGARKRRAKRPKFLCTTVLAPPSLTIALYDDGIVDIDDWFSVDLPDFGCHQVRSRLTTIGLSSSNSPGDHSTVMAQLQGTIVYCTTVLCSCTVDWQMSHYV